MAENAPERKQPIAPAKAGAALPPPPSVTAGTARTIGKGLLPLDKIARGAELKPKRLYLCGTMPDAPHMNTTVGGVSFARCTEKVQKDGEITQRMKLHGAEELMTDEKREYVERIVAETIVRGAGVGDVELWNINDKGYFPTERDLPVGVFLYMLPLPDGYPAGIRDYLGPPGPDGKSPVKAFKIPDETGRLVPVPPMVDRAVLAEIGRSLSTA